MSKKETLELTQQEIDEVTATLKQYVTDPVIEVCDEYLSIPDKRLKRMSTKRFMYNILKRLTDQYWASVEPKDIPPLTREDIEEVKTAAANAVAAISPEDLLPFMAKLMEPTTDD